MTNLTAETLGRLRNLTVQFDSTKQKLKLSFLDPTNNSPPEFTSITMNTSGTRNATTIEHRQVWA